MPTPQYDDANLSHAQIQASIPKIKRRLEDLENFNYDSIQGEHMPQLTSLSQQLVSMLSSVFGTNTNEYVRYVSQLQNLDMTTYNMMIDTPVDQIREGVKNGIDYAIETLKSILKDFEEELEDAGMTFASRSIKAYEGMELHPEIERAVGDLYRNGHYSNAVEEAAKALNVLVRLRSGVTDKDGTQLMENVFNQSSPVLKFNDLIDQSDKDEQRGFMMMFSGAVAGLRNPRAHKIIKDDPERALEYIAFISLLGKLVDSAKK